VGYHQYNRGMRTLNMQQWNYKSIDVVNGHVRRQDEKLEAMRGGIALLRRGHLQAEPLVTRYALHDIQQAFEDLEARKEGLFKVVLVPEHD
jgi:threonine dehydrogenase-like Zn-dependent dehydrogenase